MCTRIQRVGWPRHAYIKKLMFRGLLYGVYILLIGTYYVYLYVMYTLRYRIIMQYIFA